MSLLKYLLPLVATVAIGCDEDTDERTRLDGPRLLAVQSSPPALRGLDGFVALRALAVNDTGAIVPDGDIRYRVCSPWSFLIDPARDCPTSSSLALNSQELTTQDVLEFYPPPDGLAPVDNGSLSTQGCESFPLAEVPIIAEARVNGTTLVTVKRIPVYQNDVSKQNPALADVEIAEVVDAEHRLRLAVDPDSLDMECRDDALQLEALRIHVYSTSGSFESSTVDIVPTPSGDIEPAEMLWTSDGEPAILLFVVIDRDGGIDWKTLTL